jgi:cyclic pyranopterin phosphate synthase
MYLRVSLTARCNLRCTYCLPEGARFQEQACTEDEIDRLIGAVCAAVPVHKIRLTGGEPTLSSGLLQHIRAARWLVPTVGMTTNGVLLAGMVADLRAAGLDRLNISVDAADREGFRRATRRDRFAQVVAGIRAARAAGFAPLKINAVATRDADAAALVRFAIAEGVHLRFIELMDIGEAHAGWAGHHVDAAWIRDRLAAGGWRLEERVDRDEPTSRVWAVSGIDPARTSVGFITTVSDPFCATCDRIRLTSQGRLHTCLFDEGGTDLLPFLRRDDHAGLLAAIRTAVAAKAPPPAFRRTGMMAAIGG